MRGWRAVGLLGLTACLSPEWVAAESALEVRVLASPVPEPTVAAITSGALDAYFEPFDPGQLHRTPGPWWLKIQPVDGATRAGLPVLAVSRSRGLQVQVFAPGTAGGAAPLAQVIEFPDFLGSNTVFVLPDGRLSLRPVYAHVEVTGSAAKALRFARSTLDEVVATSTAHAWMISLAFGGLLAMALATALIWFVLADKLFLLYAALSALDALFVAYFTGEGYYWPILSYAAPLGAHAANVSSALAGAVACLFVREIADLRHASPRVYSLFGWYAFTFVLLAISNLGRLIGLGPIIQAVGNVVFLGSAIFTLIVAFIAWRRGNRAAGWFLLAWVLLESSLIATTVQLLITRTEISGWLLYYCLPLSLLASAVLIALGVADRLRDQRLALSDAQRRAQIDPLTGVLNRGSLIERLDTACLRAQARGLAIAVLFIDLDHFKQINDSRGHPAGDACLAAIIGPIQAELRQSDVIGRYGGEEFVVILSGADIAAAHPIAERVRARVAEVRVEGFGEPILLTCSIGLACSDTLGVWGERLIAHADAAVYDAKRSGRNRVQVAMTLAA